MELDTKHKLIIAGAVVALGVLVVTLKSSSSQSATSGTSTNPNNGPSSSGQLYLPATVENVYYQTNKTSNYTTTVTNAVAPAPNPAQSTTVSPQAPSHVVGTNTGTTVPTSTVPTVAPATHPTPAPYVPPAPVPDVQPVPVAPTHVTQTPGAQLTPVQAQVVSEQSQTGGSINSAHINPGISNPSQVALALGTQAQAQVVSSGHSHVNETHTAQPTPAPVHVVVQKTAKGATAGSSPNPVLRRVAAF